MLCSLLKFVVSPTHPSWGFYTAVWGVIIGLVISLSLRISLIAEFYWCILFVCIILISLRFCCPVTIMIALLAGMAIGALRVSHSINSQDYLKSYYNQTVIIAGSLSEDPDDSKIRLQNLRLYHSEEDLSNGTFTSISGTLYVTLSGNNALERSDNITLQGKLSSGFGVFVGTMYRPQVIYSSRPTPGDIFARLKHWFSDQVRLFIPSPEVDLGLGYLMGMKNGLSQDFSEALRAVGMTHVVVASGAHLAILTGAAKKLFGKISRFAGLIFALLMILFFIMIVGPTPSMTRAALVASLSVITAYVGRKFTPFRLISFVAMITLLVEPSHFLNLGWQLSFASFFGILIVAPRLQRLFYGGKSLPWLASMFITSLATSLICAPILIYNFGTLSLLSFIANLIILPTLPYVMLGIMLVGTLSPIGLLAALVAHPVIWLLDLHIWLVNYLSDKSAFILELPSNNLRIFILYIPVLLWLSLPVLYKNFQKTRVRTRPMAVPP